MVQVCRLESFEGARKSEIAWLLEGRSRHHVVAGGSQLAQLSWRHRFVYRQIAMQAGVARRAPSTLAPQDDSACLPIFCDIPEGADFTLTRSSGLAVIAPRSQQRRAASDA